MCECAVCKRYKNFCEQIKDLPADKREYFEAMYEHMVETEMDRDYYCAVVKNEWPSAEKVLARYRQEKAEKVGG